MKISTPQLKQFLSNANKKDFYSNINLHIHSKDGKLSPNEIYQQAQKQKIKLFAVVDHRSTEAAKKLPQSDNIIDASGFEIDVWHKGYKFHALGLNVDLNHPKLPELFKKVEKFKQKTNAALKVSMEQMKDAPSAKEVFRGIKEAGGIVVLAHPGVLPLKLHLRSFIKSLKKEGLDAVETNYPYNELKKLEKFKGKNYLLRLTKLKMIGLKRFVRRQKLLNTGGTDCHTKDINIAFDKSM